MCEGYSHASQRPTNISQARPNAASARIWRAVEVVRGVDRALDALLSSVKHLLAGVEPDVVGVGLMLLVQMCREAESVAERAVDDAVGPPVRRLQIVTVQVVSRPRHAPVDLTSSALHGSLLMATAVTQTPSTTAAPGYRDSTTIDRRGIDLTRGCGLSSRRW